MPLYEYACEECENQFEQLVPMSKADDARACPNCGSMHTGRQLSSFAVRGSATVASGPPVNSPFT